MENEQIHTADSIESPSEQGAKKIKPSHERKSVLDFRKYTKQIWLAGLGAFSRAEEVEALNKKLAELSEEELKQVAGGFQTDPGKVSTCPFDTLK